LAAAVKFAALPHHFPACPSDRHRFRHLLRRTLRPLAWSAAYKIDARAVSGTGSADDAAVAKYLPAVRKAIADNHGKSFLTLRGRVVPIEGAAPPSNVGIVEWDSVDDSLAFFKSPAWKAFDAERDKAQKTTTRFIVEVEK
jgi:uncharacterized protein (DUF1330 family)